MFCTSCGAENENGVLFCYACGAATRVPNTQTQGTGQPGKPAAVGSVSVVPQQLPVASAPMPSDPTKDASSERIPSPATIESPEPAANNNSSGEVSTPRGPVVRSEAGTPPPESHSKGRTNALMMIGLLLEAAGLLCLIFDGALWFALFALSGFVIYRVGLKKRKREG